MTDSQMRDAIVAAIQDNDKLLILMKSMVQSNIGNVERPRLIAIMNLLSTPIDGV